MPQNLHCNLLGEPQFLLDDVPLTGFISSKSQALLIYLAATGRTHTRETLATLFWDEMPDASAKKNLTKALSNLRKLIGKHTTVAKTLLEESLTLYKSLGNVMKLGQVHALLG